MKRYISLILLFGWFLISFACVKSDPDPQYKITGDWVLIDAELYIKKWNENGSNNPIYRHQVVNDTSPEFCLNLHGSDLFLDNIYKDSTTYSFNSTTRKMTLDGSKTYDYKQFTTYYTTVSIFPTEDGSARIYVVDDISQDYLRLTESGREQAVYFNGVYDNHTYYSKLTFKRKGTNSQYDLRPGLENSINLGFIPQTLPYSNELSGEKWLIYEYRRANSSIGYSTISDTITFINNTTYKSSMNGVQTERYYLSNLGSYYRLAMEHTGVSAGLESQEIPPSNINNGEIKRIGFKELIPNGGIIYLSIKKIN